MNGFLFKIQKINHYNSSGELLLAIAIAASNNEIYISEVKPKNNLELNEMDAIMALFNNRSQSENCHILQLIYLVNILQ